MELGRTFFFTAPTCQVEFCFAMCTFPGCHAERLAALLCAKPQWNHINQKVPYLKGRAKL